MSKLAIKGMDVRYGTLRAVSGVDLEVNEGEIVAVMGPNGAGKTSLFRAVSGLLPYKGEVSLEGKKVRGKPEDIVALGIGHVLEGRHIFAQMSVRDNLRLAEFGSRAGNFKDRMDAIIDLIPIIKTNIDRTGGELSGWQQQMVAIARGLLTAPKVLMMDEPSLGLAPVVVDQLEELIPKMRTEWDTTILFSDQFLQLVTSVADRVYFLSGVTIVHTGSSTDLAGMSEDILAGYLGQ